MHENENRIRLVDRKYQTSSSPIVGAGAQGETQGVIVDFRHEGFPEDGWEARHWWHDWTAVNNPMSLVFPREAQFNLDSLSHMFPSLAEKQRVLVEAGDAITIESVERQAIGGHFDHQQDTDCYMATLLLTKVDGKTVRPKERLAFFGVTQVRDAPPIEVYDRLIERIFADHGSPDQTEGLDGLVNPAAYNPADTPDLWKRAQLAAAAAERSLSDLRVSLEEGEFARVQRLVAATALAGFAQAKHELRKAEKTASAVAGGGRVRKARAKDNRLIYAQQIWDVEPSLKISALATQVVEQVMMRDNVEPMTHTAMTQSLKRAVERGDIDVPAPSPDHPANKV